MPRSYTVFLYTVVFFTFTFTGLYCQANTDKVIQAVQDPWPPYVMDSQQTPGLAVELVTQAFATQGYTLQLTLKPWSRVLKETQHGRDHIVIAAWYSEHRTRTLAFSKPYLYTDIRLFSRQDRPVTFRQISDLKGKTVGILHDYAYHPSLMTHPDIIRVPAATLLMNLRKLLTGRIDLLAADRRVALWTMQSNQIDINSLTALQPALSLTPVHVMVGKNNPQAGHYLNVFERGLSTLKATGEYDAIINQYESRIGQMSYPPRRRADAP